MLLKPILAAAILLFPFALAHPGPDLDAGANECRRQPERSFPVGSVTTIKDGQPPCRIEFRETGIRLEAVADGSHPDPGRTVVVDSDGRYYTGNAPGWEGVISVWDTRGAYLTSFGGVGGGPPGSSRCAAC